MENNRQHRDQQHRECREEVGRHGKPGSKREIIQPLVHKKPGYGAGDKTRKSNQQHKIAGDHRDDSAYACPQYLTDADLLAALFGGKGDQSQETQTGDDDRQPGKGGEDLPRRWSAANWLSKSRSRKVYSKGRPVKMAFHFDSMAVRVAGMSSGRSFRDTVLL
jgi:hypothetical protein